ncbi:hypothetical protein PMAYCL1PPCAC_12704 [Pristionchus mayeri]|uniref:KAT8 regulatory NSL complex subunit 2 n=1 Tax=Pristionchus mayeri TaxID=1317129 RepID=A0AAN4ZNH2_9BILA|nr:hypothetical protein PMAYCL1PPCAC_12704 [Pristionchus mayeri]
MTRPHSLFTKSQVTHKGVTSVPHDKFKYSQCVYTAPRTLIKCKELRTKQQIADGRGLCEQHLNLQKICAKQNDLENELLKLEVDQTPTPKYEKALRLGDQIVDPQFLTEKSHWIGDVANVVNLAGVLNDNPLSEATYLSEKELIRAQLAALTKQSAKLKEMRHRNEEKARRRMHQLGVNDEKMMEDILDGPSRKWDDDPTTNSLLKAHESTIKMELELLEKVEAEANRKTNLPGCSFEWEEGEEKKRCTENALPASELCKKHILKSSEQKMFVPCKICHSPCLDFGKDSVCNDHLNCRMNKKTSPGGTSREYRVPIVKKGIPAWHNYEGHSPTQFTQEVLDGRSAIEEEEMAEREKISQNIPPASQKSLTQRKKSWEAPSNIKAPQSTQSFMAAIMGTSQMSRGRRSSGTDAPHTLTCARVRAFLPSEFGKVKGHGMRGGPNVMLEGPNARWVQQPRPARSGTIQLGMNDLHALGPPPGTVLSSASLPQSTTPLPNPSSIQSRIKPTNERPKIKPFTPMDGEAKESSRGYHLPPSSSNAHQEALAKMYGKTPAFAPNMKKEQERRLPLPSTTRQPANRSSFPIGKAQSAAHFARSLGSDDSSSGVSPLPSMKGSLHSPRTNASGMQWTQSPLRSSLLPSPRPSSHLKSLQREHLLNKKVVPSQSVSTWGHSFQFKPASVRSGGAAQLPVKQAMSEEKKWGSTRGASVEGSRPYEQPPSLPSTYQSTKTTSDSSLPTLSRKDEKETPVPSPLSSPPQLTLEKTEASSSKETMEREKSEGRVVKTNIPFDQPIEDIEEEDDFEEEL